MPSPAAAKYFDEIKKVRILRELANDKRLKPSSPRIATCRHASLTVNVAIWDAYIKHLVNEFFRVTADPLTVKFHALHTIAQDMAKRSLERFNTPNWENTRNLLIQYTGYDPINDWHWTSYNVQQVRERLNQILKVRHSFAHGFTMPAYSWTQTATGRVELSDNALGDNELFFANLVTKTDDGMKSHINTIYSIILRW